MQNDTYTALVDFYKPRHAQLQALLGCDIDRWSSSPSSASSPSSPCPGGAAPTPAPSPPPSPPRSFVSSSVVSRDEPVPDGSQVPTDSNTGTETSLEISIQPSESGEVYMPLESTIHTTNDASEMNQTISPGSLDMSVEGNTEIPLDDTHVASIRGVTDTIERSHKIRLEGLFREKQGTIQILQRGILRAKILVKELLAKIVHYFHLYILIVFS